MINNPANPGSIINIKRYSKAAERDWLVLISILLNKKTIIASSEPIPFNVKGNNLPNVSIGETIKTNNKEGFAEIILKLNHNTE